VGADGIPEYTDFKQEQWLDYLADNRRQLMNLFRQELNTRVLYEMSSCGEYAKAHGTGSKGSNSSQSTAPTAAVPTGGTGPPSTPVSRTVRNLSFDPAGTTSASNITAPTNVFMQHVRANTAVAQLGSLSGGSGYAPKLQKRSVASQDIS
jgi:hypothetical protein